jgi:pentatricopeptide repeat protein
MRRVRRANVAVTTTAQLLLPRCHILPFSTSTRQWNSDIDTQKGAKYQPGHLWRQNRSRYDRQVDNSDATISHAEPADAATVAPHQDNPSEDNHQDEGSSEGRRNSFSIYRHKFHRRVLQMKRYVRKAAEYPDSGVGFVSLSPSKSLHDLPPFDTFWNINFAAISGRYNLAYPAGLRVGELFVNEAIARKAFDILSDQPSSASNELEGMRHIWQSSEVFATNEAKRHWWPTLMLWLLHHRPGSAAKFILASYVEPHPPFYMVADSLEYLASYYLQSSEKHGLVDAEYFRALLYVLLDACTATRPFISQKTIFLLVTRSTIEQTIYLHKALEKAQVTLHHETLLHFAHVYAKGGEFQRALETLASAIAAGADPSSNAFLATCNKTLYCSVIHPDGYHASSSIVSRFLEMGVELNQRFYSVLMVNALAANDMPTALRIFSLLEENNVEPNHFTYAILLGAYKQLANPPPEFESIVLRKAHECAIRMEDSWLATEILHCTYLHHLKGENGQLRDPIAVFYSTLETYERYFFSWPLKTFWVNQSRKPTWREDLIEPTPAAMNIILTAFLNAYPERALFTVTRFSNIFESTLKRKSFDTKPFELIRGLVMNDYTYNIFLMALAQDSKNLQHCTSLVQQMGKGLPEELLPRHPRTNELIPAAQPTAWTWSILLHAFSRHGQTAAAEKVMDLMKKRGLKPMQVTWNSLIKGYAATQDISGVVAALARMEEEGFEADQFTTSTLQRIRDRESLVNAWKEQRNDVNEDDALNVLVKSRRDQLSGNEVATESGEEVDGLWDSPMAGKI